MAALLMAGVAFTSCSSDDDAIAEPQQSENAGPKTYTFTVKASKGGVAAGVKAAGTRALADGGSSINATWKTTEVVSVYFGETLLGTLNPNSEDRNETILEGSLDGTKFGTMKAGDALTLKFLSPSYGSQDGLLSTIANTCDHAIATVNVGTINSSLGLITPDGDADFENQQAIVKFMLQAGGTPISASKLVVTVGSTSYTLTPGVTTSTFYVALPDVTSETITLDATVGDDTYTYKTPSSVSFTNGEFYPITVNMTKAGS